ncbi:hypothetical protein TUM3792_17440 [Shewanella sp. MBTL60-007]|nr:hypothetical protein TUM3792_17440 [Shewanella sp. MBTL60-007]
MSSANNTEPLMRTISLIRIPPLRILYTRLNLILCTFEVKMIVTRCDISLIVHSTIRLSCGFS